MLAVLFAVSLASSVMAAPDVAFDQSKIKLRAGDTFVLDVRMSDFPVSEGGGITLRFDPSEPGSIDNAGGSVADILFSSYKGVSGDARIATITFTVIHSGKSKVTIEESSFNPFSSDGNRVTVNFNNTDIHVLPAKKQQGNKL